MDKQPTLVETVDMSNGIPDAELLPYSFRRAVRYLGRALRLMCPVCGKSPLFPTLRQTRSWFDWFTPHDGCPRCGYAYEREPGYFLLAIWAVNYTVSAVLGLGLYLGLTLNFALSKRALVLWVVIPVGLFSLLFARHAKALFLAFDHFCDPAKTRITKNTK
jgi:uncharacterized protein (DUF983 family)